MNDTCTTILLVEDDEDDFLLASEFLSEIEDFEHRVEWATTFDAGVVALRQHTFDICLVDFRIGGLTGIEFVEQVKEIANHVPVVFLTGMGDRQMDIAAMEAGAYDFLQKSELTAATLDRTIRYAINQARGRRFLMERTALLQATLDNTGAGIAAIDASGRLVTWNDRFVEVLDRLVREAGSVVPEQSADTHLGDVIIDESFPQLRESCDEYACRDGMIYSIGRNDIGEGGAVIVCHDITQQKQTERALRDAKQHAEAANRAKSALIANMSHELRTPLNAIIGFADLIVGQAQGPIGCADYEGYVGFIRDSGNNLLSIINATIDLARIEANEYTLDVDGFAVSEALATSAREMEQESVEAEIAIDVVLDDDSLSISSDAAAVTKIVTQILSNAIKFSQAGSSVLVRAAGTANGAAIEVSDKGIGMEAAEVDRALVPFAQVDQQFARNYEGAGLGLPLARSLVHLLDGDLSVRSAKGQGTTVRVELPNLPQTGQASAIDRLQPARRISA